MCVRNDVIWKRFIISLDLCLQGLNHIKLKKLRTTDLKNSHLSKDSADQRLQVLYKAFS